MTTLAVIRSRRNRSIAEERLLLAIDATLRNPASTIKTIIRQRDELIDNGIEIYECDVAHWIFIGMEHNAYELLDYLVVLSWDSAGFSPETRFFDYLLTFRPQLIGRFLSYPYIQQNAWRDIQYVANTYNTQQEYINKLTTLFKQPNTLSLLESLGGPRRENIYEYWRLINPELKKKREMRFRLVRFWLLTVRRNLKPWIEHLYDPDGGPLVMKTAKRFLTEYDYNNQKIDVVSPTHLCVVK